MRKKITALACVLTMMLMMTACNGQPEPEALTGLTVGGVVASHPLAVQVGQAVLEEGGNAVDAAIAVSFALNVVEPYASGIGGGGFMLVVPAQGEPIFLDYRERAPGQASPDMFVDITSSRQVGGSAVAVPGQLRGMERAHALFGTQEMASLMAPAIDLARYGYEVLPVFVDISNQQLYKLLTFPELGDIYLEEGLFPNYDGGILIQSDLADTLELLADEGFDVFYSGELAAELVETVVQDGGIISEQDLAAYKVRELTPLQGEYGPYTLYTSPPPSSGGTHLLQLLQIWERYPGATSRISDPEAAVYMAQAMGLVYMDQQTYMADPDFETIPLEWLLSPEYATERVEQIIDGSAAHNLGLDPASESTTSFVTVDSVGNVVVVSQTINHFFGSGLVVPGRGIILNNEMADFSADPESPNAPAPHKTPVSNMTPTIILKDSAPAIALGSPGGRRIISTLSQVIIPWMDGVSDFSSIVDEPRIHYEGDELHFEEGFSPSALDALTEFGFRLRAYPAQDLYFGGVTGIAWQEQGVVGVYDRRREGDAFIK